MGSDTSAGAAAAPITFIVPGQRDGATRGGGAGPGGPAGPGTAGTAAPSSLGLPGHVKDSVRVGARRAGGAAVRVTAQPGEDVVVLHVAGGPALVLHPENARDLMLAQGGTTRSQRARQAAGGRDDGAVPVPAQLRWRTLEQAAPGAGGLAPGGTRGGTRGLLGDVLIAGFEIVTGFAREPAAQFVASAVVQRVDGQVDPGVYALQPEALPTLKGSGLKVDAIPAATAAAGPLLVFLHGTFVDTASTFGKLWALYPQRVRELFTHYGGRVYALDHPTLGESPIGNALTLVQALPLSSAAPAGVRLHLATHSRGGLVAEVLARMAPLAAAHAELPATELAGFAGADYAGQRAELQALHAAMRARGVAVDRVVRVACPARGTLLASKRLDAYLSVLRWGLDLAGVPALPSLLGFLAEVARRRADPMEIPGLAAMIAGTPLLDWINGGADPVPGDLRVVAGDLQGDSLGGWVKTLLADAYYWTDNDIVVQTRSMYGGSARAGGASFLLDQGGKSTHFNYFANARTVDAVVAALTLDQPPGYRAIGPLSWAGQDSGGLRARRDSDGRAPGDRPAVFVLPGILGSHLKVGGQRIWLSLRLAGGLGKLAYAPGGADGVAPDGPIGLVYDELIAHLDDSHEVIPFAFDWRRPIEEEAQRLADAIDAALDARNESGQAVRIVAHSMGGVLARTVQLERPATWARWMAREGSRLLMLGTPNGGSWAPMQVLSGDDTFGNALAACGSPLRDRQARQLMAAMPGFLQLQAGLRDPALKLADAATWARLAADDLKRVQDANWWHRSAGDAMQAVYEWGLPPQDVLDRALALRERLDRQCQTDLPAFADRLLLVTGHAKFTPDGYELSDLDGLSYLDATDGGDGRVVLASALLPGVRTWTLDAEHGGLPSVKKAFAAYQELLVRGDTALLPRLQLAGAAAGTTARGAGGSAGTAGAGTAGAAPAPAAHVRSRPSRGRGAALPPAGLDNVFQLAPLPAVSATATGAALRVGVVNGNLSFVRQPLLVGHYRSLQLTGTERVIDRLVGGAMSSSLTAGLYPELPGSHQVFLNVGRDPANPWRAPRPACVVVIGLGEEGKLRELDLALSVRQGVIAWAQRVAEDNDAPTEIELAATLMGSGGIGMSPGGAARAIAQGVRDANERLSRANDRANERAAASGTDADGVTAGWPLVGRLTLVELYLERASDAWRGLQVLGTASPGRFEIDPVITAGVGPLRRQVDTGYRSTDYDYISATTGADDSISFTLDTRRARTEVRAQMTQGPLLRELVGRASTDTLDDPRLGRTLFQLLVPPELEPFLGGTSQMLLELDPGTAPIPWELLDTADERHAGADPRPWAIRSKLLRKLRTQVYRETVHDASADDAVLVIGEPMSDPEKYDRLPGAQAEAVAVHAQIAATQTGGMGGGLGAERVRALLDRPDAAAVINALLERSYRVVHIAGHGEFGAEGGVVLSGGTFLGPREIQTMRTVPELVFVNCCHLAGRDTAGTLRRKESFDRCAFAAGVADSLIAIGVRCVIAAGWAVEDVPAQTFATTFYAQLFSGAPFINAVAAAREAAWAEGGQTWAAYQCYGDPHWTWRGGTGDAQGGAASIRDQYEGISSPLGLALALEELAVQSTWMRAPPLAQLERARHLEARFGALWGGMGAVAEAFALTYREAGDTATAIAWYRRALGCNDASASLKAHEVLGNLLVRQAWEGLSPQARPTAAALRAAREQIDGALQGLQALVALQPTAERLALLGSACKRLAMLEQRAGRRAAQHAAVASAAQAYARAEALALAQGEDDVFYPVLNRMALEVAVRIGDPTFTGFDPAVVAAARQSLTAKNRDDPDFWSMVGRIELDLYDALAGRRLAAALPALDNAYLRLHERVDSSAKWGSLADQGDLVLTAYAEALDGAEAAAARQLLARLHGWARRAAPAG